MRALAMTSAPSPRSSSATGTMCRAGAPWSRPRGVHEGLGCDKEAQL